MSTTSEMIVIYITAVLVVATFATIIVMKIDSPKFSDLKNLEIVKHHDVIFKVIFATASWVLGCIYFYKGDPTSALLALILCKLYVGDKL